jgi:chromosome segregation ATPase
MAVAIAALFVSQTFVTATPQGQFGSLNGQLANEQRAIETFALDLARFETNAAKQNKSQAEKTALQSTAADLKRRLAEIRSAFDAALRKIREAGKDNADFDNAVLGQSTGSLANALRRNSGARALLRQAINEINGLSSAIDAAIQDGTSPTVRSAPLKRRKCFLLAGQAIVGLVTGCKRCREAAEKEFDKGGCNDTLGNSAT